MIHEIMRKVEFDAGHRVYGHEGKCAHLHGHRYVAEIYVRPDANLDKVGRVVDFSVVKAVAGEWIDSHWDHNVLLHHDDPLLVATVPLPNTAGGVFGGKQPFVMPGYAANPTAENMAHVLYNVLKGPLNRHGVSLVKVRIWETPNCFAEYLP